MKDPEDLSESEASLGHWWVCAKSVLRGASSRVNQDRKQRKREI